MLDQRPFALPSNQASTGVTKPWEPARPSAFRLNNEANQQNQSHGLQRGS